MTALTWDNLDEFIASLPKGEDGHFLPNPNPYVKNQSPLIIEPKATVSNLTNKFDPFKLKVELPPSDALIVLDNALNIFGIKQSADAKSDVEQRALESLANLTLDDAKQEIEEQRQALQKRLDINNMSEKQLDEFRKENLTAASTVIERMDQLLEHGGRVGVEEKQLLNCKADLNQLVPFKYNEAWSAYLISCEHHWMPPEMSLDRMKDSYLHLPTEVKSLVARAYMTYLQNDKLMPESVLLNIYRLVTNPECRQYLLRQSMESILVTHAWKDINEILGVKDTLLDGKAIHEHLKKDDDTFKYRSQQIMKRIECLHDLTFSTANQDNVRSFVSAFIILYGYVNFMMPLVSYYQVIQPLVKLGQCQELVNMFYKLIQDNVTQLEFAKVFVANVLHENPEINDGQFKTIIVKSFKNFIDIELDLVSSLSTGSNEFKDIESILNHYKGEIISLVDPSFNNGSSITEEAAKFINTLNSLKPKLSNAVGLGGGIKFD